MAIIVDSPITQPYHFHSHSSVGQFYFLSFIKECRAKCDCHHLWKLYIDISAFDICIFNHECDVVVLLQLRFDCGLITTFFGGDRFFFCVFFSPGAFVSTRAELIDFSSFFSISMTQLLGQMIQIFKRLHIIMYSSCWVLWYSRTTDPFSSCRWPVRSYTILYIPQLCARLPFFDANEMLDEKASFVFLVRFIH